MSYVSSGDNLRAPCVQCFILKLFTDPCFPLQLPSAILRTMSYWVQQAAIWGENGFSVTTKIFYSLVVLWFLNHEDHYHYA